MVRVGPGNARSWLRRVETAHGCALRFPDSPARGEVVSVLQGRRMEIKKIGIESDDHVRLCEIVERLRAENAARFRIAIGIARERIPLMPSCARKLLRDFLQLRGKRWRGHGLGKKSDARSAARGLCAEREIETLEENAPGADGTLVCQGFGSIRIIKVEQISLRPNRGGPETARMITVSLRFSSVVPRCS